MTPKATPGEPHLRRLPPIAGEQQALRDMLDELRALARELTEDGRHPVLDKKTGTITTHPVPSLLEQLRDAIGRDDGRGDSETSGRRSGSPEPISLGAVDLLQQLEADAAELHRHAMTRDTIGLEQRIRAIVAVAGRWTEPTAVHSAVQHLRGWTKEIRQLLDPPPRYKLTAPCPACGVRMAWVKQDGEIVQVPALTVDGKVGCTCLACHHVWPPAQLEHLARVIGCEPIGEPGST